MNVEYFKEEFTNFLRRFTAPSNDTNILPITCQEIHEAVKDVINSKLDVTLVNLSEDDVKTPAAGIIVTTPDAPDIPKVNNEHGENGGIPGRFRSLDTLTSEKMEDSPIDELIIPGPPPSSAKIDDNVNGGNINVPNSEKDEKKIVGQSVSQISSSVNTLVRSDTYVRENELNDATKDDGFGGKNYLPQLTINELENLDFPTFDLKIPDFRKKLNNLRDAANELAKNIDDFQKVAPDHTRPIRRLSTIGCFPNTNRVSTTSRTIQRPKMTRRSMTTFPGTPTSSRSSPGPEKIDLPIIKSTSTTSLLNIGSLRFSIPSTIRSVSSGALIVGNKSYPSPTEGSILYTANASKTIASSLRSASSGGLKLAKKSPTQGSRLSTGRALKTPTVRTSTLSLMNLSNETNCRPPKNPKYAHVQSTISKLGPVLGKRKADEF